MKILKKENIFEKKIQKNVKWILSHFTVPHGYVQLIHTYEDKNDDHNFVIKGFGDQKRFY